MEREKTTIDKLRKVGNVVDIATIIAGGLLGLPALSALGIFGVGFDQSVLKETSRAYKQWKNKKKE